MNNPIDEKVFTYNEWHTSMLQHRKEARRQTISYLTNELRLEVVGLQDIANILRRNDDEQNAIRIERRIARIEKILLKTEEKL